MTATSSTSRREKQAPLKLNKTYLKIFTKGTVTYDDLRQYTSDNRADTVPAYKDNNSLQGFPFGVPWRSVFQNTPIPH